MWDVPSFHLLIQLQILKINSLQTTIHGHLQKGIQWCLRSDLFHAELVVE